MFYKEYELFKDMYLKRRKWKHYKCLLHCMVLMRNQAMIHTGMQKKKNDLDIIISGWKFLTIYFAMHKGN